MKEQTIQSDRLVESKTFVRWQFQSPDMEIMTLQPPCKILRSDEMSRKASKCLLVNNVECDVGLVDDRALVRSRQRLKHHRPQLRLRIGILHPQNVCRFGEHDFGRDDARIEDLGRVVGHRSLKAKILSLRRLVMPE